MAGARSTGSTGMLAPIIAAKIGNTGCPGIRPGRPGRPGGASGGPNTGPAGPAALAIAMVIEPLASPDARPTTACTTPEPMPAMPKPIRIACL